MRISDWSSDVCSSDLVAVIGVEPHLERAALLAITVRAAAGHGDQEVATLADMPRLGMAAPCAEAAAFDPRLKAVTQRPGRRRDRIDRAAKARRAEPEAIGPAIDLQMRAHQRVDILKVARSVGRVHRCTVDQQGGTS